ncbi:MAG: nucleoside-diphosphate sugar epimerase/dehydratase [Candidatus Limnocylindria bacterium]
MGAYLALGAILIGARSLTNLRFGLYRRLWEHASISELIQIVMAVMTGSLMSIAAVVLLAAAGATESATSLTPSFWVIEGLLYVAMIGGVRFTIRVAADSAQHSTGKNPTEGVPTILYGAGRGGVMVVRSSRDGRAGIRPVGFIDEDVQLHGKTVAGIDVHGNLDDLADLAARSGARQLLITISRPSVLAVRRIVREANRIGLEVRTIPPIHELFDGSIDAYKIRRIKVEDLLRRPPVSCHVAGVDHLVADRVVLITGAGGSIGSELARQVHALRPKRLLLLDRAEGPLYGIQREIELAAKRGKGGGEVSTHIANVASRLIVRRIVRDHQPDIIFHAAAYKHVPMMEEHPSDAVQVNIGGTLAVLDAAAAHQVPRVVFVSTDKAVRPSSVMGATKRVAEALVCDAAMRTGNRYVSVRFGNVLGSSGSVVPIFQQQLERGDPITITHPEMTRYFMTIPEAVSLILDAAAIGSPGSLLVLDMGEPIRILDLAHDLIRLSGRDPESVPIEFTGLRAGEKLHEELFYATESVRPTQSAKVMLAAPQTVVDDILNRVARLISLADGDHDEALRDELFDCTDTLEATAAGRPTVAGIQVRPHTAAASLVHGRGHLGAGGARTSVTVAPD